MAVLIQPDGTTTVEAPKNDAATFSLEELQAFVGGYIELLRVDGCIYVLNEEGKLLGLPVNAPATRMARAYLFPDDCLCGSVLICAPGEIE